MNNGIILLICVVIFIGIKFIIWTIRIHQHNLKIQDKLGKDVYNWVITDGKPLPPPIRVEIKDFEPILTMISIKTKLYANQLKAFQINQSQLKIRMEQNEF
jgi:hypothetical protein